jgi:dolichol-phosphate mannosyltransferase
MAVSRHGSPEDLLSIVLLSFESEARLQPAVGEIVRSMEEAAIPFELIIMDDGSSDRSVAVARALARSDARIRVYRLSRNYGSPASTFAGLSVARGACAVAMPDDLQTPPEVVVEMYRLWQQGHRVVVASRRSRRDGLLRDWLSNLYYRLMNRLSEVRFPPGGSDRFLADREVLGILNSRISTLNTTPIMEVLRLGFEPRIVSYDRPPAGAPSRWTLRKKLRLAADTFFGSSSFPLRLITLLGFVTFAGCLGVVLVISWARLFTDSTLFGLAIHGWATTMVVITMFNGLILLSIGIVAEYVWRVHEEVKARPGFVIRALDDADAGKDGAAQDEGGGPSGGPTS